ncbi:hypothetical protein [Henriciella marina]|uniref:hypothetical protein n=1 Tax=Henriciella marina TaxID=453851 RepID=UPI000376563A|nr:hypothetical protein [Henriciella marina]
MTQPTSFIEEGIAAVRDAVVETMDRVNVDFRTDVTQAVARYARRQIKLLETMLRRLLVLIAAEIELAPAAPAEPSASKGTSRHTNASAFQLVPSRGPDNGMVERLREIPAEPARPNTASAPLLHRLGVLLRHLDNPEPLARRMAHMLSAASADGDPRPHVPPQSGLTRVPPRLALMAHALPVHTDEALRKWFDTS